MGTRATIVIKENGKTLVRVYRQFDGYPTGLGKDILAALADGKSVLTNGYGSNDKAPAVLNGMGCLAAYLIGKLKGDSLGNVYVFPSKADPEEYEYTLYVPKPKGAPLTFGLGIGVLCIKIVGHGRKLYDGPLAEADMAAIEAKESEAA